MTNQHRMFNKSTKISVESLPNSPGVGDSIKRHWCARYLSNESFHCWNHLFGEASLS